MPRIHTRNILIDFGPGFQGVEAKLDVPFPVKRVICHPPRHNARARYYNPAIDVPTVARVPERPVFDQNHQYMLYAEKLNHVDGVMGMLDTMQIGQQTHSITIEFEQPKNIKGEFKFSVRSFQELANGASVDFDGVVWQCLEFHDE